MKLRVLAVVAGVCTVLSVLTACGSGGSTTTVIKEAAPTTVEKTVTEQTPPPQQKPATTQEAEPAPEPEPEPKSAPNVIGLPLPEAEEILSEAGFKTYATNTDTTFGIVIKSHYTICKESKPRADRVTVLAQKYGC